MNLPPAPVPEPAALARQAFTRTARKERLKDWTKRAAGWAGVGLSRLLGSRAGEALGILVYHRIAPHRAGTPRPTINVRPEQFHAQLAGLQARGFRFRALSDVLDCHDRGEPLPPRTVVVTFDDGFETVYTRAWPVLQELRVRATVFVSTAYLDSPEPFPFDAWGKTFRDQVLPEAYRPLTTAQCSEMVGSGLIELGAHTHTHQDFRDRPDAFRDDLQLSADLLRSRFRVERVTFAFPFGRRHSGHSGEDLMAAARQAGVACGLTTECTLNELRSDPFGWGRFNAYDWDTPATLAAKLEGWYGWAPGLQEWLVGAQQSGNGAAGAPKERTLS